MSKYPGQIGPIRRGAAEYLIRSVSFRVAARCTGQAAPIVLQNVCITCGWSRTGRLGADACRDGYAPEPPLEPYAGDFGRAVLGACRRTSSLSAVISALSAVRPALVIFTQVRGRRPWWPLIT